jgi:hypothetical protein
MATCAIAIAHISLSRDVGFGHGIISQSRQLAGCSVKRKLSEVVVFICGPSLAISELPLLCPGFPIRASVLAAFYCRGYPSRIRSVFIPILFRWCGFVCGCVIESNMQWWYLFGYNPLRMRDCRMEANAMGRFPSRFLFRFWSYLYRHFDKLRKRFASVASIGHLHVHFESVL